MFAASLKKLDALRDEWNVLLGRSSANTVFSTWEWQDTWWRTLGGESEPHLLAVREDSRLVGIVPLAMRDGVLSLAGGLDVSDYLDIVAEVGSEKRVISALLAYLETLRWDHLDLHYLRHNSPTLALLPEMAREAGLSVSRQQDDVCPAIALPRDWEFYLSSLSKKDRHELRRKLRRLEQVDGHRWVLVPAGEESDGDLSAFVRLCRLSRQEKAFFMDERMEGFFRSIVADLRRLDVIRLYFLEMGGERVAAALCFEQGQELWLYNSGYDQAYSSLSVGLLLKAHCIRDAIGKGMGRFDFLRGTERYKYDLGGVNVPIFGLHVAPR